MSCGFLQKYVSSRMGRCCFGAGNYSLISDFITTVSFSFLYLYWGDTRFESLMQLSRLTGCPVLVHDFRIFPDECLATAFLQILIFSLLILFDAI